MNKFNLPRRNIQKERRQKRAERRKHKATPAPAPALADHAHHHGDDSCCSHAHNASTLALSNPPQAHSAYISGKRKAKLQKKWRRAQKEALQSGLITMDDIEMIAAGGEDGDGDGGGRDAGATTEEEEAAAAAAASLPKAKKKFTVKKRIKLRTKAAAASGGDAMVH